MSNYDYDLTILGAGAAGLTIAAGGYLFPHAAGYKVWTEKFREWVAVMNGGVKLSTIASSTHPYPIL